MRNYEFSLTAGAVLSIGGLQADFIRVVTSSGPVEITPNQDQPLAGMRQGMSYRAPQSFSQISFLSETSQNIEVMIGFGNVSDDRVNGQIDTKSKGANLESNAHTVGTSAAVLLAADETRRSVMVKNRDTSNSVWLGHDATVTAANGFEVEPGQVLVFDKSPSAAFYAIGDAAAMDVRTMSEFD